MKRPLMILSLCLAGCASSPEYVARQSNWDVCRLTMGGPHSGAAEAEARARNLDCKPMYPAIQGKMAQENQATGQAIQQLTPQPVYPARPATCRTVRIGNSLETQCL